MTISGNEIHIAESVHDSDFTLMLKYPINKVVRVAGSHLRTIAFIKKYLDEYSIKKLVRKHCI